MEKVHRLVAGVCGEISIALIRGAASRGRLLSWAERLRSAADQLEERAGRRGDAPP